MPLSLEEAKQLLISTHGVPVDAGDPVMMLVTLHMAIFEDYEAMLARHNEAVTLVMSSAVNNMTERLHKEREAFAAAVQKLVEQNTSQLIEAHIKAMRAHRQILWCAVVSTVAVPAVMFGLLFGALLWKI